MVIDSHRHFWRYTVAEFGWIADEPLKRDFLPGDTSGFPACVAVEARQSVAETEWLLGLSRENLSIAGVVGWLPVADAAAFPPLLEKFAENPKLAGLRHVVQDEPDDAFILRRDFMDGVRRLRGTRLVYDILVFQRQLANAVKFVEEMPDDMRFVLDHAGKPFPGHEDEWATLIREMARHENVSCKFSGVVTEVGTDPDAIRRVFDTVLEAFGPGRVMWGGDWPVVAARMDYAAWLDTVRELVAPLAPEEREAILGGTAARVYNLEGSAG